MCEFGLGGGTDDDADEDEQGEVESIKGIGRECEGFQRGEGRERRVTRVGA